MGRLDLQFCANSGQVFRWALIEDGSWLGVDGEWWYRVWGAPAPSRYGSVDALAYVAERRKALSGQETETLQVASNGMAEDFARLFRLEWDAEAVEREILRRGPEMEPYLGTLAGLRLLRPSSSVETFFCFLCTPNNNIARITQMVRHLATYGPVLEEVEGRVLHRFPDVETIALISDPELRARGFGYRAATIPTVARQVLERGGEAWIESLKGRPYDEAHAELTSLSFVGPKLADCIALFALHDTGVAPVDTHLWQALTRLYFPQWRDTNLTDMKYRHASAFIRGRFGELTGWAHQYLFYDNVLNWRTRK